MDNGAGDVDDLSHLVDFCQTGVRGIGRVGTGSWASAAVGTGCCTAATHPLYYQPAPPTQHQRQKYTSDLRHYHWAAMSPLFCKVCVKHLPDIVWVDSAFANSSAACVLPPLPWQWSAGLGRVLLHPLPSLVILPHTSLPLKLNQLLCVLCLCDWQIISAVQKNPTTLSLLRFTSISLTMTARTESLVCLLYYGPFNRQMCILAPHLILIIYFRCTTSSCCSCHCWLLQTIFINSWASKR